MAEPLVDFIAAHQRLLVLTGAGCSTASGIPDYRDQAGAWKRPPPMTYQTFTGDPAARQRYWARSLVGWQRFGSAAPNARLTAASPGRTRSSAKLVTA